EAPDLDLAAGVFGFRFGEADACDLRITIGAAGHFRNVERVRALHARDAFGDDYAFMHALVREPWRTDEIADGPDAGRTGGAPFVDDDVGFLDLHARLLQPDVLDIADDADGKDHAIHRERFGLAVFRFQGGGDGVRAPLQLFDRGGGFDFHALLHERLVRELGDFFVFDREHAVEYFHHRHVASQRAIEAGELDADGAGAHNQQRFRESVGDHGFAISPDQLAVRLQSGERAGARAGGEHDVLGGDLFRLAVLGDGDLACTGEFGFAVDDLDLVLLHQEGDAVGKLVGDLARTVHDLRQIEFEIVGAETEFVQAMHQVPDFRGAQQRFRRDAAPVEADAAELFAFDNRG